MPLPITAAPLAAIPGLRHGFFTREGGESQGLFAGLNCGFGSGDDRARVAANRARVAAALAVAPEQLVTAYQIHSADAVTAENAWAPEAAPKGDGLVTARAGLAIGVLTADCVPVLFADPVARIAGAAHAGWKGARAGVTDAVLAAMEARGAERSRIIAAIGPAISQAAYEVGPEFRDHFAAPGDGQFFLPSSRPGHQLFDLPGYVARRLAAAGCGEVALLRHCTYGDESRFYSFRRATHRGERDYGRLIAAIAFEPV